MMDRMIFLVIGLCLAMGVQATPELAQKPMAKVPQYNVSVNRAESDVLFHKPAAVRVSVPSFEVAPAAVSVGAPLKLTSAAVVHSSANALQGVSAAAIMVGGVSVSAAAPTAVALPMVAKVNTRTSFAPRTFMSADEYLGINSPTKRAAPPSPPTGTNADDKKLPLATTWGDLCLLMALCIAYGIRRKRQA